MADKTVGELPQVSELYDDSLLIAEQQGEAVSVPGSVLKNYAKSGVDALVTAAQEAAARAEQAAKEAEGIAAGIEDVSDDAAAAVAAAQAAENARAAAVSAQQAAEQAAALAAEQAAADVKDELQTYVDDANQAKNDAQTAADNAATQAAQGVEEKLQGYVSDAEQAKTDAQNAAGTAATDATAQVDAKMAQYLADAQAAQAAAEKARDEAQAIAGGDFLPTAGGTMTGALTLAGDPTGDLQAVPKRYSDNVFNKIISRGEQLVINGNAALGNNTNFPKAKYDGSQANFSGGSFTSAARSANVTFETEQYVLLDPFKTYRVEFDAKSDEGVNKFLAYLDYYDIDKKRIENKHVRYYTNTLTELAQDLNDGDTVVHLKSLDVWYLGQAAGARGFTFWNYTNSFGYTYPANTYSRNVFSNLYTDDGIDNIAKTITLTNPWSGGTIPAGTKLSQPRSGGNPHWYFKAETVAPTEWTKYDGEFTGVDYSGNMLGRMFSPGTAFVKIGIWVNYQSNGTDNVWVTNISLQSIEDKSVDPANLTDPVPIEKGGTGAASAADALANLGALPLTGGIMTGALTPNGGLALAGKTGYIAYPEDGYYSSSNYPNGFLYITLPPTTVVNAMVAFKVRIYNHVDQSVYAEYVISGFATSTWRQLQAYCTSPISNEFANLPVRFVRSSGRYVIVIGNQNAVWQFPKIAITDILVGHTDSTLDMWKSGWSISFSTTAPTTIDGTFDSPNIASGFVDTETMNDAITTAIGTALEASY